MDLVLAIIGLGLGFFLRYLWDKNSKHPSKTVSTKDRYRIVEETAVCEAGDITRAPHSWNGD